MTTLRERFERFLPIDRPEDGCWEWQGKAHRFQHPTPTDPDELTIGGSSMYGWTQMAWARVAWYLANGPIPNGMFVCHTCDNERCVNPKHLWLGTPMDNIRDAQSKGRLHGNTTVHHKGAKHHASKLSREQCEEILRLHATTSHLSPWSKNQFVWSVHKLAAHFGVDCGTIDKVLAGIHWSQRD